MTFQEFRVAYFGDTLKHNATWRAYDLVASIRPVYIKNALKRLGYRRSEFAMSSFVADFAMDPTRARDVLGAWYLLTQLELGRPIRGLKLRQEGPQAGGGATTLALTPPAAA